MIKDISAAYDFTYRGFEVEIQQDDDKFYWIIYRPDIDKDLDSKYNKASRSGKAEDVAKKAIDEHLKRRGK